VAAADVFQKAVELEPGHAGAHLALAGIHAREQPPSLTLARWHYARALESGASRDVGLEQRIETERPPARF
jgi:hypothetical protein